MGISHPRTAEPRNNMDIIYEKKLKYGNFEAGNDTIL
jgi:hypothetical protein